MDIDAALDSRIIRSESFSSAVRRLLGESGRIIVHCQHGAKSKLSAFQTNCGHQTQEWMSLSVLFSYSVFITNPSGLSGGMTAWEARLGWELRRKCNMSPWSISRGPPNGASFELLRFDPPG
ncbi:hypothetical protein ACO22_05366 [Paracoccidioides brasiliensis]|uniref:Rhodanese domain-containing protein n=1 Tax=Paracoccidioides brasiliensis TaxID=121759 RepID=A0A1D2JAJ1_PARBR|nr:hypothetical protein ACO22_05366 [Paracoccidioides brasiliensis]